MAHLKEQLVKELMESGLINPDSSLEWKKRPDKIKNAFLFEQAAIAIAKRKLAIRERLQEKYSPRSHKISATLERLQQKHAQKVDHYNKLVAQKTDLDGQLAALQKETNEELAVKQQELDRIVAGNQAVGGR